MRQKYRPRITFLVLYSLRMGVHRTVLIWPVDERLVTTSMGSVYAMEINLIGSEKPNQAACVHETPNSPRFRAYLPTARASATPSPVYLASPSPIPTPISLRQHPRLMYVVLVGHSHSNAYGGRVWHSANSKRHCRVISHSVPFIEILCRGHWQLHPGIEGGFSRIHRLSYAQISMALRIGSWNLSGYPDGTVVSKMCQYLGSRDPMADLAGIESQLMFRPMPLCLKDGQGMTTRIASCF